MRNGEIIGLVEVIGDSPYTTFQFPIYKEDGWEKGIRNAITFHQEFHSPVMVYRCVGEYLIPRCEVTSCNGNLTVRTLTE